MSSEAYPRVTRTLSPCPTRPFFPKGSAPFSRQFWLAISTVYGLEDLLLFCVVEHVFVIDLVYWMLAFDAQTAERKNLENGAEPSGKKGRVGKGLRVLVTLGYASLRVRFTSHSVNPL